MRWEIIRIPGNPPASPLNQPTVDVVAAVVEPKLVNTLVRQLSQVAPLEDLRHVKRVRKRSVQEKNVLSIILCPAVENGKQLESIPDDILKLIAIHQLNPFIAKVAKYAASSKDDWKEQCKLWPTSYHPHMGAENLSDFTNEEVQLICSYMRTTIELTKCHLCGYQARDGAVIVDPSSKQVISTAVDRTFLRPAYPKNTKDVKIMLLSDSHKNGRMSVEDFHPICKSDACVQSSTASSCLYPWNWVKSKSHPERAHTRWGNGSSWHPLKHAVMVAIDNAATRDRKLFPVSVPNGVYAPKDELYLENFPLKRQKTQDMENGEELSAVDGFNSEGTRPYLCTGYDIYLVCEPCMMCAMALVHQRIRRIFYAFPNPNAGALGSVHRLHGEKSLNHHYSVFRVLVEDASDKEKK